MSKIFITSDLHFGHKKIIEYENRPFTSVEEMDNELVKRWNRIVQNNDKVYVLGDVSFYGKVKTREIIKKLHGYKVLILGNHDRIRSVAWWLDAGFDEVCRHPIVYNNFLIMQHEPPEYINQATPFVYMYGHVHGTKMYQTITDRSACVCVERWNYTPIELDVIINKMQSETDIISKGDPNDEEK